MKYMHKNKLVPPTSTYGQGNHAPTVEEATDVFIAWLKHRNPTRELGNTPDNWSIHPYENAFTVVPSGGRRSNYMYILRGDICLGFAQSMVSFKTAYAEAQNDTGAISWEDQRSYEVRGD